MNKLLLISLAFGMVACGDPHKKRSYGVCEPGYEEMTYDCEELKNGPAPKIDIIPAVPIVDSDYRLDSYVADYVRDAANNGMTVDLSNVPVTFGETASKGMNVLAYCTFLNNGQHVIVINEEKWRAMSEAKRKLVMTHEMGHCQRGLAHNTDFLPQEWIPKSLMYPKANEKVFTANMDYYLHEFFHSIGPKLNSSNESLSVVD